MTAPDAHGRPVRIALVIHSMTRGGAERATANMANWWVRRGHPVALISLDSGAGEFYELDASVERIALDVAGDSPSRPAAMVSNARRIRALRRCLRRFAPDVAIGMMNTSALLVLAASLGMRCTTIGAERTWPARGEEDRFWATARRHGYAWLDAVVTQTEAASQWLREHTGAKCPVTIPNALRWPIPAPSPTLDPAGVVDSRRNLLLAVGRPEHVKGFDLLLAAFAIIAPGQQSWDLAILGEGSQRKALIDQAARLGLSDRVHLPGECGNVGDWYTRADLFVLSSRAEGFPNVLVEAMASGCAVVATRCNAGPADIIRDGVDGRLVPPDDIDALAAALDDLMGDAQARARLARFSLEVRERFSEATIMARWEALFPRRRIEERRTVGAPGC